MMTTSTTRRSTTLKVLAPLVAAGLLASACGSDDDGDDDAAPADTSASGDTTPAGTAAPGDTAGSGGGEDIDGPEIRLRAQDFSESITITEVYGQFLESKGYEVEILTPAGFRTEALDGLANDDFDLIIDYIGGTQAALAPDEPASADPAEIISVIEPLLADAGATILEYSPAVDGDAMVVRGDSEATTISDLAGLDYVLGASAQCPERPQCLIGLEDPDIYGITFADYVTIEFGPLLGEALGAEEVDAVIWNTTAPQITENNFKVLEDDQGLFPAQNIAPIIDTALLEEYGDDLAAALDEISAMITTDYLLAWNVATDIDLRESDDVAEEWLAGKGIDD
jgi:osmoprotectant transport system substrate-binding protein